jgi:thiol-disulfide isomerase/thioredoxin
MFRRACIATLLLLLVFSGSSEVVGQLLVRGKILDYAGRPFSGVSLKTIDFVSTQVVDSAISSNDGAFSVPIRRLGVHHIRVSTISGQEYQVAVYIEKAVELDIRLPRDPSIEPQYSFRDAQSHTARLFAVYSQLTDEFGRYRKATKNNPVRPGESSKGIFDWDPYVARLNRQLVIEHDPLVHQAILLARLVPSVFGDTLSSASARAALNAISPQHPFWEEATISCYTADRANYIEYLDSIVQSHPDPWTRVVTMFSYLPQGRAAHDSVRVHRYAARLISEFPDCRYAKMAVPFASSSMRDLSIGDLVPAFTFLDLHHPTTQVSSAQFRGKVHLIAFWATWCIHCVEQMPFLRAAYEKYHDKGLEILSVAMDDKPEVAASFLAARPRNPWYQTYVVGGFNNTDIKQLGVFAVPTEFLIDTRGTVVATTNDLIRSKLDSTLSRIFK